MEEKCKQLATIIAEKAELKNRHCVYGDWCMRACECARSGSESVC